MKKIYVLTIFFLLGSISCQDRQQKKRERIKASAEFFSAKFVKNNNGTIGISHFSEISNISDTYSVVIRFPQEYSLEDMKKIVLNAYSGLPPWSYACDWTFKIDRYFCILYDTGSDIIISYGYHPSHPAQLAILVNSLSDVKE